MKARLVVICFLGQRRAGFPPLAEGLAGPDIPAWSGIPRQGQCAAILHVRIEGYADVTALLDTVGEKTGGLPPVAAVGQGFGAAVLLKAASEDPRIRCMVSMDCFPSLKTVAMREMEQEWGKPLCYPAFPRLMDAGVAWRADFSTFDVAPVDYA